MTEREQSLTTADIANQQTERTTDVEDADRPVERDQAPAAASDGDAVGTPESEQSLEPLLPAADAESFRGRWESVQTGFVDSPRQAVEEADGLVAELMQRLAQSFTQERESLEAQWSRGDDVSTEDLRVGLQRYRSFFERLLST